MLEYFLDTSVIVAYASCFGDNAFIEEYGEDCERLIESDNIKIISKNVEKELDSLKRRRTSLYREIISALSGGLSITEIESQIEVDDRLREHLRTLIELAPLGKFEENIETFRRIEQLFGNRIRKAKRLIEIIDVHSKFNEVYPGMGHNLLSWGELLGVRIGNRNDGKIVIDCVALSAIRCKQVLTTLDYEHILSKEEEIMKFVNDYCSTIPSFSPNFHHLVQILSCATCLILLGKNLSHRVVLRLCSDRC